MATRQNSLNGKPKSPRIQVVLPEELCARLTYLAENESRTVSNMAKVLIQEGVNRLENEKVISKNKISDSSNTDKFRSSLEAQQKNPVKRNPRKIRLRKP